MGAGISERMKKGLGTRLAFLINGVISLLYRVVVWSCDQKNFAPQELEFFFCTFVVAPRTLKSGYFVLTSMAHGNFLPCAIETHIKMRHFEKLNKINHKNIHFQILFASSLDNY